MLNFYWIFSKIDVFENPSLKIDGFGRTHQTHASYAPEIYQLGRSHDIEISAKILSQLLQEKMREIQTFLVDQA